LGPDLQQQRNNNGSNKITFHRWCGGSIGKIPVNNNDHNPGLQVRRRPTPNLLLPLGPAPQLFFHRQNFYKNFTDLTCPGVPEASRAVHINAPISKTEL
jgi:hypothetical protein